jgi:hypothetical protein
MKNAFDTAREVAVAGAQRATDKVRKMVGVPKDKSLNQYKQLSPEDFNDIMNQFGEETTLEYIRKMETKLAVSK